MSQEQAAQGSRQGAEEFYSISDAEAQREYVQVRRASKWVPFFLPHLKSGMRLLDCGCGVGSITPQVTLLVSTGMRANSKSHGISQPKGASQMSHLRSATCTTLATPTPRSMRSLPTRY